MIRIYIMILLFGFSSSALAVETVQFTNKELNAVFTLMRPELNSIELQGRSAIFDPSPSLKFLGIEHSEIPLNLTVIANIVDLEFNHLKTKMPILKFQDGSFQLVVPVEDQSRGVQSNLGSISFSNVVLTAQLAWQTRTDGSQELVLQKTSFGGTLKGTGVLRSNYILGKTRELCMTELTKALKKMLDGEKIQNAVSSGLINYGKFYTGIDVESISPGSIQFFSDGIKYDVN
jgi:hypothetical protein